jgi:aspartyl-tRNA(Asn)/glutamyl-tRNA(Gln) amidotransferase subunit A
MKQTFGLVPKSGCVPLGYSRDHIGPLARTARDCAIMLQVMAGYDASDLTSVDVPVPDYTTSLDGSLEGLVVGVEREHHFGHPAEDPAVRSVFEAAVAVFEGAGARLVEVSVPHYGEIQAATQVAARAESFAYHRLDLRDRRALYGVHTKDILIGGALCTGWEYVQTQRLRSVAKREVSEAMSAVDVLLTPAAGVGAPPLDGLNAESFFKLPSYTSFWNNVGLPAFCIPMGFASDGLPLSLQIVGKPFDESVLFRAGDAYQQLTDWHLRLPPIEAEVTAA